MIAYVNPECKLIIADMFLGLVLTVLNLNHLYDVCNTLRPSQEGTSKGDHKVWELLEVMYRLNRAPTESLCTRHIYRGSNADMSQSLDS